MPEVYRQAPAPASAATCQAGLPPPITNQPASGSAAAVKTFGSRSRRAYARTFERIEHILAKASSVCERKALGRFCLENARLRGYGVCLEALGNGWLGVAFGCELSNPRRDEQLERRRRKLGHAEQMEPE